jgi:hypothetical protein
MKNIQNTTIRLKWKYLIFEGIDGFEKSLLGYSSFTITIPYHVAV